MKIYAIYRRSLIDSTKKTGNNFIIQVKMTLSLRSEMDITRRFERRIPGSNPGGGTKFKARTLSSNLYERWKNNGSVSKITFKIKNGVWKQTHITRP